MNDFTTAKIWSICYYAGPADLDEREPTRYLAGLTFQAASYYRRQLDSARERKRGILRPFVTRDAYAADYKRHGAPTGPHQLSLFPEGAQEPTR